MKKTKIAFLISTLDTGGAERQLINTINGLDIEKYTVKVFVLRKSTTLINQLNQSLEIKVLQISSYVNIFELCRALNIIRRFNPDILHSVMYASNIIARLYKFYDKNCRIVNHVHGLGTWIRKPHIYLDRILLNKVDKILVVSRKSYFLRLKREKYPENKMEILYNSLNTNHYSLNKKYETLNDTYFIFGSASRLIELKQIHTIINLVALLNKRGIKVKYYIAGTGPLQDKLMSIVVQNELQDLVCFLGQVDDMPAFYSSIDVFIMNSKTEDFPLSIVEAFSSGLYVIAPDIGGIGEIISGKDALLFDGNLNAYEWVDEVITFLNSKNIKKMSLINRQFAIDNFDDSIQQKHLENIYLKLIHS